MFGKILKEWTMNRYATAVWHGGISDGHGHITAVTTTSSTSTETTLCHKKIV